MDGKVDLISKQKLKELLQQMIDWDALEIYEEAEKREEPGALHFLGALIYYETMF